MESIPTTDLPPPTAHALSTWTTRLGTRAVQRVLEENKRLGIPSALVVRGRLVFEMPDGTLTTDNPFEADAPTP